MKQTVRARLAGDQLPGKMSKITGVCADDNITIQYQLNNRRVSTGPTIRIGGKDLAATTGRAVTTVRRNTCHHTGDVAERTENWSGAGGDGQVASTHQTMPLSADESDPDRLAGRSCAAIQRWRSSQAFATARALLERRVTSNWFVGTAIIIQQAKIGTQPFLLYVRYSPPDGR